LIKLYFLPPRYLSILPCLRKYIQSKEEASLMKERILVATLDVFGLVLLAGCALCVYMNVA